jgi:hypothetical protein
VAIDIPKWSMPTSRCAGKRGRRWTWRPATAFAREGATESNVDRREINVYDPTPAQVGSFDV